MPETITTPRNRRDQRYRPSPGTSFIEFDDPNVPGRFLAAELTQISVAGLAFEWDQKAQPLNCEAIENVLVRIDNCELRGDLVVRSSHPFGDSSLEIGCLFYPSTEMDTVRLMAMIAGMRAVAKP